MGSRETPLAKCRAAPRSCRPAASPRNNNSHMQARQSRAQLVLPSHSPETSEFSENSPPQKNPSPRPLRPLREIPFVRPVRKVRKVRLVPLKNLETTAAPKIFGAAVLYSGGESNSYQKFRKLLFYPLNYRSILNPAKVIDKFHSGKF